MRQTYQRLQAKRHNESGFTLIELLIVIVILGVLAGIVVFAVAAFNNDGKQSACKTDMKTVETAIEAYYAKTGAYPPANDFNSDANGLVNKGYLKDAPPTTAPNLSGYTISFDASGTVTGLLNAGGSC